ncbi:hydrogenase/urease maturation nickel metallochaperone HypA, partial [Parabacteroides sp.]
EGQCSDCESIFPMNALFSPCPHCGSYLVKILKGKELRVKSIVIKKE